LFKRFKGLRHVENLAIKLNYIGLENISLIIEKCLTVKNRTKVLTDSVPQA